MPDDVKISEMSEAASLDNSAQFPYVQSMNGNLTTLKAPMSQIGTKINEGMTFSNLQTTSKTIVGAINEAAQGGGIEYATELPISPTDPTNTKLYIDTKTTLVKSASGDLITISDGGDNIPMKSLASEIVAVESGSGTKSPTNPYTISGFSSGVITVTDNDQITNTYTFTFGQTVYGGHFDNKGNLVVTHSIVDLGDLSYTYGRTGIFYAVLSDKENSKDNKGLCSCYPIASENATNITTAQTILNSDLMACLSKNTSSPYIYIRNDSYTDADLFKTAMTGQKLVYELATPITLSITSQAIPTLSGVNNIFSNCGDLDIEYFTSSADGLAALIEVLSNS